MAWPTVALGAAAATIDFTSLHVSSAASARLSNAAIAAEWLPCRLIGMSLSVRLRCSVVFAMAFGLAVNIREVLINMIMNEWPVTW